MQIWDNFDYIYFIGTDRDVENWYIKTFAPRVVRSLPHVDGLVAWGVPEELDIKQANFLGIPAIHPVKMLQKANKGRVLLIDFSNSFACHYWVRSVTPANVTLIDFYRIMHDADQVHLYWTLRKERAYVKENMKQYQALRERLSDDLSKAIVDARLKVWETLDRTPMFQVNLSQSLMYFNAIGSPHSFCLREDEILVDVGAAHGDTIIPFFGMTRGRYRKIIAFEADPHNYQKLVDLGRFMPHLEIHEVFLGEETGEVVFYQNPDHRHGSHANEAGALSPSFIPTAIPMKRLDDLVEEATLIKIDVEGAEVRVLQGARSLIQKCKPRLAVACYHFPQDILEIYDTVMSMHPYKKCILRHYTPDLIDSTFYFSDN